MTYLEQLRKKSETAVEDRKKQLEESEKPKYGDDRLLKITLDKNGTAEIVIRFLPPPDGETVPYVDKFIHAFKGTSGRMLFENCPTSIKEQCPICDANKNLYKKDPKLIKESKRWHKYFSNIYVVDADEANKESVGKVFLYEYGEKIYTKIKEANKPLSSRQKSIDPFDIFNNGANFVLIVKKVEGQWNYDSSNFESPAALDLPEEKLENILSNLYSLKAIVNKNNFKSYEDLEKIYKKVMDSTTITKETEIEEEIEKPKISSNKSYDDLDELPF